jgi:hypothetical protein
LSGGRARDVIRARDGEPDVVDCGRSIDFAIVDPVDHVRGDCELVSDGAHDKPRDGKQVIVDDSGGTNALSLPGMDRDVPLQDRVEVPVQTSVDASAGRVTVMSQAQDSSRQSAEFSDGRFRVEQQPDESVTEATLEGGERCTGTAGKAHGSRRGGGGGGTYGNYHHRLVHASTVKKRSRGRRRRARAAARRGDAGRFRTVGVRASATAAGEASWQMEDRCDGTITRVKSGTVQVRDLDRNKTVTLTAGESYLARSPR